jgi:hypothetical protein
MKKLRADIDKRFEKLDERWRTLPLRKQHKYTLYFFLGYLLLTNGVILKVWYDTHKSTKDIAIGHIENPVLKKKGSPALLEDTIINNFKK